MGAPSGAVISRPMVTRACGCVQEFQFYAVDRYRAERMAKFQQTRCPACVAKLEEERRLVGLPKKSEAFKSLPTGANIAIQLLADGSWSGKLTADGESIDATEPTAGPQSLMLTLTRLWLTAHRSKNPPTEVKATASKPA
jgi:hypothetical protein